MKIRARVVGIVAVLLSATARADGPPAAELGAVGFAPSAERPVGWRGDGSGRYPGAAGPTTWERTAAGDGYATKGIAWMSPLPAGGVGSPIVVGDRIFLTGEVCDLICLDKASGRVLWIRSSAEFEGLSKAERDGEPAFAEKLAPLAEQLAKANDEVVLALNARQASAMTAANHAPEPAIKRKRELEKQIADAQSAIDKKRFGRYWGQAVFGFSGPTPTSDGKHVCAFYTTGVAACYDLDGNRLWATRGTGNGSEHGNFASPLLCDGRLIVWANEMRAYDAGTGALAWTTPGKAFNTYGSLFRVKSGADWVAGFQWGFFTRVKDGKAIWDQGAFGDSVTTPVVEGDTIFAAAGYPRFNDKNGGLKAFKIPADAGATGKLKPAYDVTAEWAADEIPTDKVKAPFDRGFVASPLVVDGLIYRVTQGGGLLVNEAATGALVYRKVLALKPRTHYWDWAGCGASPTLGGRNVYLMDNQGTTLVIRPGRAYDEVARNFIAESREGKEQAQNLATPAFEGGRMYYRTPGFLYCIGEK